MADYKSPFSLFSSSNDITTKYLIVRSIDRDSISSSETGPEECRISSTLIKGRRYELVRFTIDNTFRTIESGINNTFRINNNGAGWVTVTIASGNYTTTTDLDTALTTAITTALSLAYSVTITNDIITITSAGATFALDFTGYEATAETLGFKPTTYSSSGTTSITAPSTLILRGPDTLYIGIDNAAAAIECTNNLLRAALFIPVGNTTYGDSIDYVPPLNARQQIDFTDKSYSMNIRITDARNVVRDSQNSEWVMTLKLIE
jgi:hypothetical protein